VELRQLRYFLAVVRLGSFSAAAEELGRTQQAVSKGVQQLEERLGVRLVDRSTRQPQPTAFGELLLKHASTVDAALQGFERELAAMRAPDSAPLRIGASATASSRVVSTAIVNLLQRRPGHGCQVFGGTDMDLLPRLDRNDLDVVVALHTQAQLGRDLRAEILGHESYVVVAGRDHPLARAPVVSAGDLAAQAWLEGINLGEVKGALRGAFEAQSLPMPAAVLESTSIEFARSALASGKFVSVLPLSLLEADFASGRLRRLRVAGFEWSRPLTLFRRRGTELRPAVLACVDALHQAAAGLPATQPARVEESGA
jgi:DNA-binding transcriptional LysR family regulator